MVYPPVVKCLEECWNINQVDFAADAVVPEHNETLAEF